jgi:hypothetical protein
MQHDLLEGKPDLVFIEFAVNDSGTPREELIPAMEGMVRKIWTDFPETDICFVYTSAEIHCTSLLEGKQQKAVEIMEELAAYYGIPSIHAGLEVVRLFLEGKLILTADPAENAHTIVFTRDKTHPLSESGHPIYASVVTRYLEKMSKEAGIQKHTLPQPLFEDNWEKANMIDISKTELSGKWEKLSETHPVKQQFNSLPAIYKMSPGSAMHFKFRGKVLGIFDCIGPGSGSIEVWVDGQKHDIRRFDQWCDNYRKNNFFIKGLSDEIHDVTIKVIKVELDKPAILSLKNIVVTDPKKYIGLDWYPVNIMIMGDIIN